MTEYIDSSNPSAFRKFSLAFEEVLKEKIKSKSQPIVFVCIGTDRCTGDSLGPLIGYKLSPIEYDCIHVYGTLDSPVHAKNLVETISLIKSKHNNAFIIAIDACLGDTNHIGYISISDKSVKPGAAVNKDLPDVGDISITGVVNFGGFMDFLVLQNTRLNIVVKMADLISSAIKYTLWKLDGHPSFSRSLNSYKASRININ